MNQTNFVAPTKAGQATRFGPDWPGRRCLAKTRQNPAIKGRGRCKLHGGLSIGPRAPEGKARSLAAHIQIKLARKIPLALFRTDQNLTIARFASSVGGSISNLDKAVFSRDSHVQHTGIHLLR